MSFVAKKNEQVAAMAEKVTESEKTAALRTKQAHQKDERIVKLQGEINALKSGASDAIAAKLNEEKNEFMGIAAHDLRNPLGAIKGYAEMVVEDAEEAKHSAIEENGLKIQEVATRMVEMVQNLLDANRIERGEMRVTVAPAELGGLVASVVETQRPRAEAKEQTIHFEQNAEPTSVFRQIRQI